MDKESIIAQAEKEIEAEEFKAAVQAEKLRILRNRKRLFPWFPWRVVIININK